MAAGLPDPGKPSLPLPPETTATWGPFTATKFFVTATFTATFEFDTLLFVKYEKKGKDRKYSDGIRILTYHPKGCRLSLHGTVDCSLSEMPKKFTKQVITNT